MTHNYLIYLGMLYLFSNIYLGIYFIQLTVLKTDYESPLVTHSTFLVRDHNMNSASSNAQLFLCYWVNSFVTTIIASYNRISV